MPEQESGRDQAATQPTPPRRPAPPPYKPDKELIGYIEQGQKPPAKKG